MPSILESVKNFLIPLKFYVLNLVISGMPSIQLWCKFCGWLSVSFKPCYKWNAFNTNELKWLDKVGFGVLNLVISGMPSILMK